MPNKTLFGLQINPGPFNVKEHVLLTIMATVGGGSAYAVSVDQIHFPEIEGKESLTAVLDVC